jgi:cGMP-dependent protein kinase
VFDAGVNVGAVDLTQMPDRDLDLETQSLLSNAVARIFSSDITESGKSRLIINSMVLSYYNKLLMYVNVLIFCDTFLK